MSLCSKLRAVMSFIHHLQLRRHPYLLTTERSSRQCSPNYPNFKFRNQILRNLSIFSTITRLLKTFWKMAYRRLIYLPARRSTPLESHKLAIFESLETNFYRTIRTALGLLHSAFLSHHLEGLIFEIQSYP